MQLCFSQQIFEKSSNIKFRKNPFSGSRAVPCGQRRDGRTDTTKLKVAFRNFANAPRNENVKQLHNAGHHQGFTIMKKGRAGLGLTRKAAGTPKGKGLDLRHSDNNKTDFTERWFEIHLGQDRQTNRPLWTWRESSISWQSVAYPDYMNNYQLLKALYCMGLVSSDSSLVTHYDLHIQGSNPRKGVVFLIFTTMDHVYTLSHLVRYGRSLWPNS